MMPDSYFVPCIALELDCPYADKSSKKQDNWLCVGVRPPVKAVLLYECPRVEVARETWAKAQRRLEFGEKKRHVQNAGR